MDRYISITTHDHMDKMDRYICITTHNHKTVPMFLGQNQIMSSPLDTADRALANSQLSNVRKEHAWNGTSSEILLGRRSRRMVVTCKQTDKKNHSSFHRSLVLRGPQQISSAASILSQTRDKQEVPCIITIISINYATDI